MSTKKLTKAEKQQRKNDLESRRTLSKIWVVVEWQGIQFKSSTGEQRYIAEGTFFQVNSIATDPKDRGFLILEPTNAAKPGFKLAVWPRQVRVFTGPLPDYRLDVFFVEFGYEAQHYRRREDESENLLEHAVTTCRDFGGSYKIPWLIERILKFADRMILSFKSKL